MYRITLSPSNDPARSILLGAASAYPILEAAFRAFRIKVRSHNVGLSTRAPSSAQLRALGEGSRHISSSVAAYLMDKPRLLFDAAQGRLTVENVALPYELAGVLAERIEYQLELCTLYRGKWSVEVEQTLPPGLRRSEGRHRFACNAITLALPHGTSSLSDPAGVQDLLEEALWAGALNTALWGGGICPEPFPTIVTGSLVLDQSTVSIMQRPLADIDQRTFSQIVLSQVTFSCDASVEGAMFLGLPDLLKQGRLINV